MKITFFMKIAVIVDIPDGDAAVGARLPKGPLDELAVRLRREARYGRDYRPPDFTSPDVTAWKTDAYGECPINNAVRVTVPSAGVVAKAV